jgi:Cu-Zn family superoxide dismutase
MNRIGSLVVSSLIVCTALAFAGCNSAKDKDKDSARDQQVSSTKMQGGGQTAAVTIRPSKAAATQPANTNVTGNVTFTQQPNDNVHVVADLTGLSPGKHGFHIHDKGDLSDPQLTSAGPHYNPTGAHHGGPNTTPHHAGDLGNVVADDSGNAHLDTTLSGLKVSDILGRSVIVHAKEDDLKTDPAGNSGGRIAGGVIEAAK